MVEVCGVKHMKGVGKKSGEPYDAYIVHFTRDGKRDGFDGFVTGEAWIPSSLLDGRSIRVGDKLRIFYGRNSNYVEDVEFID